MEGELRRLLSIESEDEEVRAIVITGVVKAFCAGAETGRITDAASGSSGSAPAPFVIAESDEGLEQRYSYVLSVPKPIIAAINGAVAWVGGIGRGRQVTSEECGPR